MRTQVRSHLPLLASVRKDKHARFITRRNQYYRDGVKSGITRTPQNANGNHSSRKAAQNPQPPRQETHQIGVLRPPAAIPLPPLPDPSNHQDVNYRRMAPPSPPSFYHRTPNLWTVMRSIIHTNYLTGQMTSKPVASS